MATSGADFGSGQSITLAGCGLYVAPNVKIDGTGGVNPVNNMKGGSDIELIVASRRCKSATTRSTSRRPGAR